MSLKRKPLYLVPAAIIISLITGSGAKIETNQEGINLLLNYEKCSRDIYYDSVNVATQSCGDTLHVDKHKILSDKEIADILVEDLKPTENCVNTYFDGASMNDNQFSAMVVLTYNIGCTNAKGKFKPTNLRTLALNHNYKDMCHRIRAFNMAGGKVIKGLDNRRKEEEVLCLKPVKG